jgi:hypothetical protein
MGVVVAVAAAGFVAVGSAPASAEGSTTWNPATGTLELNGYAWLHVQCSANANAVIVGPSTPPTVPCNAVVQITVTGTPGADSLVVSGTFPALTGADIGTGDGADYVAVALPLGSVDLGPGDDSLTFNHAVGVVADHFAAQFGPGSDIADIHATPALGEAIEFFGVADEAVVASGGRWSFGGRGLERLMITPSFRFEYIFGRAMRDTSVYIDPGTIDFVPFDLDTRGRGVVVTPNGGETFFDVPGTQRITVADPRVDLFEFDGRPIDYVDEIFWTFLGRPADDDGLFYWYEQLQSGLPREQFVAAMLRLPEHAGLAVDQAYADILGRGTDPAGRAYWSDFLQRGGPLDELRALLYGSPEYFQVFGGNTTSGFFDALYTSVLHRAPDGGGRAYWTDLLDRGLSRVEVARAIVVLPEPIRVAITDWYIDLLGRAPGASELDFWQHVWQSQGEFLVTALIAGSGEYYDLVAPLDP